MIFSQVVNMVNLGIAVLDKDLRVCHWNRWLEMHTGIPEKTIQNTLLLDHFPNLNQKWFLRGCKTVFTLGNVAFFSHKLHRHVLPITAVHHLSSEFKFMRQNCTIGPIYSDSHKVEYICMMIQDATEVAACSCAEPSQPLRRWQLVQRAERGLGITRKWPCRLSCGS